MTWLSRLRHIRGQDPPFVRAVIFAVDGSTRRRIGASMVIDQIGTSGTLGGGLLDDRVTAAARRLLGEVSCSGTAWSRRVLAIAQGPILGQPSSGAIHVLLEVFGTHELRALEDIAVSAAETAVLARVMRSASPPVLLDPWSMPDHESKLPIAAACRRLIAAPDLPLAVDESVPAEGPWLVERLTPALVNFHIHGNGEVAAALARVLEGTPFLPLRRDPSVALDERIATDRGAYHAVLTGSHETDLEVCLRLLTANHFAYLGMIGSRAKRDGVMARIQAAGLPRHAAERIACPIGLPQVRGKEPAVIAIAIAAEAVSLLRLPGRGGR